MFHYLMMSEAADSDGLHDVEALTMTIAEALEAGAMYEEENGELALSVAWAISNLEYCHPEAVKNGERWTVAARADVTVAGYQRQLKFVQHDAARFIRAGRDYVRGAERDA